jgi:hypothetical protein
MFVSVLFNLVGLALVAFSFTAFKAAVGAIHEVYAMVALGFGLLIMAVASGTGAIVNAVMTTTREVVALSPAASPAPPPVDPAPATRVASDWNKPRL